jgi:prepilin-type processing-associated H-X9-DG protein
LYGGYARIDYAGNAGDHAQGRTGVVVRTGVGVVRFTDIVDGASQTVLLGEKQLNRAMLGLSADDNEPYATPGWNDDWDVYRWGAEPPAADRMQPNSLEGSRVFGSAHPHGFNVAWADGSVRFLRYSVSATIWRQACVRNDLQTVLHND